MPIEIRVVKRVSIEDLGLPPPTFVRDGQNRITQMRFDYASIRVQVNVTWIGATAEVNTYTRTVSDL